MLNKRYGMALIAGVVCCAHSALVINEVCYDNSSVADEKGDTSSDWIELYNSGPSSVNVNNYGLGDSNPYDELKGVRLPNYTIPSGGFLVVFANSDLAEETVWTNAPNIALIPANATWRYSAPASAPVTTWNARTFNDASWALGISPFGYNDAKLNLDCATVLGYGGSQENRYPTAFFRKAFNVINPSVVTGLVIHARINDGMALYLNGVEVLRQNMPSDSVGYATLATMGVPSTLWTNFLLSAAGLVQGTNVVAVEVHQASAASVDLIMDMTVMALVNEQVPIVHGQFGLSKAGEKVHLFNSGLANIHKYDEPLAEPGENTSYGLTADGVTGTYKVYEKPTPGLPNASNTQKYSETLLSQKPSLSVPPGFYQPNQSVVLNTAAGGLKIYYTLDGSAPWNSSAFVYSGQTVSIGAAAPVTAGLSWIRTNPVEISNSVSAAAWQAPVGSVAKAVVLRAIAVSGTACSPETRGTYFIGTQFTNRVLPVVSLITDTNNLFGFASGLYIPGKHYADSPEGYGQNKWGKPYANYHQDSNGVSWEKPVFFELFETSQHTAAVAQVLGVAMHGGGTRSIPQKTLYLMARLGEYGSDLVNYALFPDEPAKGYKRFLLRNSGNDWYGPDFSGIATMMKDAVFHRMVKGLDLAVMAYRPTVTYINGEYWGLHNLRESFDKHYLATRYGLEADNMDLLMHEEALDNKVKITRIDGDKNCDEEYEAMIDWVQEHPLSLDANYQQVQAWIDVTNHTDYIIAETFFGNTDWPINNCDFWRAHTNQVATCGTYGDTRWRWMLYDLDVAGEKGADFDMIDYLADNEMTGGSEPAFLINQLWSNIEYRNHFVTRYANLLNTTFRPERLAGIITQAADEVTPAIEQHFRRWGRETTQAQWQHAVSNTLTQYTATRHAASWQHLNAHFDMGGIGSLSVRNSDAGGAGGRFIVNGVVIDLTTEGVTDRAAWTGTFFRSLSVSVLAVPDEGYVFDSWAGMALTDASLNLFVGAAPTNLTARFRRADAPLYTVTFDARGGEVDLTNKVVAFGAAYGYLPVPAPRTHYAFGGWWTGVDGTGAWMTEDSAVTSASDHALYAKWILVDIIATFDPEGGIVTPTSKIVVTNAAYGELPTPSRPGYAFGGWWTGADGTGTRLTEDSTVTSVTDHSLFAKWTANDYTILFDPQNGTVSPADRRVTFGEVYGELPVPTRPGYSFEGWTATTNDVVFSVTSNQVVSIPEDHTLAAVWTAKDYTLTFDAQGGEVEPANKSVTFAAVYGFLPELSRVGFAFGGWWTGANGTGTQVTEASIVTRAEDHTVFAKWTASSITVLFAPEGGTVSPLFKTVAYSDAYGVLPIPLRVGFAFGGWWTGAGGAGTRITEDSTVTDTAEHTVYAKWTAHEYTVTFNPQGGTVDPTNKVVTFDAAYGELPEPAQDGYTFTGWQAVTNGVIFGVASNTVVSIAAHHTLDASWATNNYIVIFDAQGGTLAPTNTVVTFDAVYGELPEPVKEGYSFAGWQAVTNGIIFGVVSNTVVSIAAHHTLYAKWTPVPPSFPDPYLCAPTGDAVLTTPGSYDGFFYADRPYGGTGRTAVRGTLTVKITGLTGKFTAKAVLQTGQLSFSAKEWTATEADGSFRVKVLARGGETLELFVRQNRIKGTLEGGALGSESLTLDGARNRFADKADTEAAARLDDFKGYYTVALPAAADGISASDTVNAAPQGVGYLTLTAGAKGAVKIAGVLADGTKVVCASRLLLFDGCGPEACVPLFTPLYSKKGWTGGLLWLDPEPRTVITDRDLGWYLFWQKPGSGPDGFQMLLDACGGFYSAGTALASAYLFTAEVGEVPYVNNAGEGVDLVTEALPAGVGVTVAGARMTMVKGAKPVKQEDGTYLYDGENSSLATLSFTARTGLFKGAFSLYYDDADGFHKAVKATYAGVLTPVRSAVFADVPVGEGHCLVPDNDPAAKVFKIKRSFPVWLETE